MSIVHLLDQIVIWWKRKKKEQEQMRLAQRQGRRADPKEGEQHREY